MKNVYFSILAALVLTLLTSFNTPNDCKKYFSGKWKYDELPISTICVTRNSRRQFEYLDDGKYFYEYKIKWLSACEYKMIFVRTTSPSTTAKSGDTIFITILNINANYMKYKATYSGKIEEGTMTKIN